MNSTRKSILEMDNQEAKQFLLKPESFFNMPLPNYINLSVGIGKAVDLLKDKSVVELSKKKEFAIYSSWC